MKPKRRLTQVFFLMLSSVSLVSILLISVLWVNFENMRSDQESTKIRREYIATHEEAISLETNRICDYMEAQRQASEIKFLKTIKDRVYEAYDFVVAVDSSFKKGMNREEQAKIKETTLVGLNGVRFNHNRGRYFIANLSGQEISNFNVINYERPDILDFDSSDYSSPAAFVEISASLARLKEGFYRYTLNPSPKPETIGAEEIQIAFLKVFEPWGWILGTSEYMNDWAKEVQAEMIEWASTMTLPASNYLTIVDYNGNILSHTDSRYTNKNAFSDIDEKTVQKIIANFIRSAKDRNKGFLRYNVVDSQTGEVSERIAFFRAIPSWHWVVVTWVYFNDLETVLDERQEILAQNVRTQISRIVAIAISMLLVIMLLSKALSSLATRSFAAFFEFFEQAASSSTEMNPDAQPFAEFSRLAEAANNMICLRKLTENLLRESELKFKTIFDVSPQVITISDLNGILIDANEEFRNYSRLAVEDAIGKPLEDSFVITSEMRRELWQQLKDEVSVVGLDVQSHGHSGESLDFLVFGRVINLQARSFILAIFTNISALKAAENEKLVLQEKLSRSTKMEAMGLMAAEVAHDLNNILSGIIGYPQLLLLEPNITEKQKEALKEILETGQRAAAVVSDLLTIARGVASIKVSLPINDVVNDYVNSPECRQLKEFFPNVELALRLDDAAGNIIASSVHLTKVVMNLVSNAFEAISADKADARVQVTTGNIKLGDRLPGAGFDSAVVEPGDYVFVKVGDNGPGIPAEDVDKIFEPFYSKKVKGRSGTGLGLAIVWNTINDHQGHLEVHTDPSGTAFTIYFKRTDEKTAGPVQRLKIKDYTGNGERILVVDDVDIQRKLASKMLATLGYEPVAVSSGEAAVKYLENEDVDLVILDMIMHPGMNGRETYGAIMEFKPTQKAIIASGMAETDEVAKAQAMGAGQFVNKPYTIEDIAMAVYKALRSD